MAREIVLGADTTEFSKQLSRSLQSGHINILIGSGGSLPSIPLAGGIEAEISSLFASGNDGEALSRLLEFMTAIQNPTNALIRDEPNADNTQTVSNYADFLGSLENVLSERRTTLLPKQATVFTTNYDLFIEKAAVKHPALRLNDGFTRIPSLENRMVFSSRNFFNATYNTGNFYSYKVEIPCINLVKVHGSLTWQRKDDEIIYSASLKTPPPASAAAAAIQAYLDDYAVVLPQSRKFRTTMMERNYYELLRIFANALDRENSLLLAFGFSFGDEHIRDIVKRALQNPTLRLLVFAYSSDAAEHLAEMFGLFNNAEIIAPATGETLGFVEFNALLRGVSPYSTASS